MQPTQQIELHLPQDIIASMNEAVASGQYDTPDEIVLILLEQWRFKQQIIREELRILIQDGIASGRSDYTSASQIIAETRRLRLPKANA